MKLAISARGPTLDSEVDPRFGRAEHFIFVDTDSGAFEAVANDQDLGAAVGAGIQAAKCVADRGAEAVLTGHCGPNAFRTLQTAGIAVCIGAEGTVKAAVDAFVNGSLVPAKGADVEGHW